MASLEHSTGDELLRALTFPEEERCTLTTAPWRGEYRWFSSHNIVALEHYRTPFEWKRICATLIARR